MVYQSVLDKLSAQNQIIVLHYIQQLIIKYLQSCLDNMLLRIPILYEFIGIRQLRPTAQRQRYIYGLGKDRPQVILGWCQEFSSGFQVEWGYIGYPGGAYRSWDFGFPVAYSRGVTTVNANAVGSYNINAAAIKILAIYATYFTLQYTGAGNNSGTISGVGWLAHGGA